MTTTLMLEAAASALDDVYADKMLAAVQLRVRADQLGACTSFHHRSSALHTAAGVLEQEAEAAAGLAGSLWTYIDADATIAPPSATATAGATL